MTITDVIPARWRGTLLVLALGVVFGSGVGPAVRWLEPPSHTTTLADDLVKDLNQQSLGNTAALEKLTNQMSRLVELIGGLESRIDKIEGVQRARYDVLADFEARLRVLAATQISDRALIESNLRRIDANLGRIENGANGGKGP